MKVTFTWADGTRSTLEHESATKIEVEELNATAEGIINRRLVWPHQLSGTFQIGDTVRYIEQHWGGNGPTTGAIGQINRHEDEGLGGWGVAFQGFGGGHNLDGALDCVDGWYCLSHQLERVEVVQPQVTPEIALVRAAMSVEQEAFPFPYPTCDTECAGCRAALGRCLLEEGVYTEDSHGRCLDRVSEVHEVGGASLWYHEVCVSVVDDAVDCPPLRFG